MTIRQVGAALVLLILAFGVAGCVGGSSTPPDPFIDTWKCSDPDITLVVQSKLQEVPMGSGMSLIFYQGSVTSLTLLGGTANITTTMATDNQISVMKTPYGTLYTVVGTVGNKAIYVNAGTLSGNQFAGLLTYAVGGIGQTYLDAPITFARQ